MPTWARVATQTSSGTTSTASPIPISRSQGKVTARQVGVAQVDDELAHAQLVAVAYLVGRPRVVGALAHAAVALDAGGGHERQRQRERQRRKDQPAQRGRRRRRRPAARPRRSRRRRRLRPRRRPRTAPAARGRRTSRTPSPRAIRRATSRGVPVGASPEVIHQTSSATSASAAIGAAPRRRTGPRRSARAGATASAIAPRTVTARLRPIRGGRLLAGGGRVALGEQQHAGEVEQQAGAAGEDQRDGGDPHDDRVDPKCSARPPQTPAIQRSRRDRTRRGAGGGEGGAPRPGWEARARAWARSVPCRQRAARAPAPIGNGPQRGSSLRGAGGGGRPAPRRLGCPGRARRRERRAGPLGPSSTNASVCTSGSTRAPRPPPSSCVARTRLTSTAPRSGSAGAPPRQVTVSRGPRQRRPASARTGGGRARCADSRAARAGRSGHRKPAAGRGR